MALVGLLAAGRLILPVALRAARSWPGRLAVTGRSMAPGLLPGDWLLVDPAWPSWPSGVTPGDLVVVTDPRRPDRLLVKRVRAVHKDGRLNVQGDAAAASTDSRIFGPVALASVLGRPWFRYWPPARIGRLR